MVDGELRTHERRVDGIRPSLDHRFVEPILDVGLGVLPSPQTFCIGLVLGEEEGWLREAHAIVEVADAETRMLAEDMAWLGGTSDGARVALLILPTPRVPEPKMRQNVDRRG